MKFLFLIYLFCLFVIFTPGIFITLSKKKGLNGVILHGILFALVVFLSMKLFKNKLIEGLDGETTVINLNNLKNLFNGESTSTETSNKLDETVDVTDTDKIIASVNELRNELTQRDIETANLQKGSDFDSKKFNFNCRHNLKNGNFDRPILTNDTMTLVSGTDVIPDWRVTDVYHINNSGTWGFETPYPEGNQAIAIQNEGKINTDLNLPPGRYKVHFLANGRTNSDQSMISNSLSFILDNKEFDTIQPEISVWKKYTTNIFTIKRGGRYVLTIKGNTQNSVNKQSDKTSAIKNINISRE